jgi:hypothetical protein
MVVPEIPARCKDDIAGVPKSPSAMRGTGDKVFAVNPITLRILSQHENTGLMAMQLLRDSWNIFKDLTLRDWADDVLQVPSIKVELLRLYYNRLAFSFMTFLRDVPDITKYHSLASV